MVIVRGAPLTLFLVYTPQEVATTSEYIKAKSFFNKLFFNPQWIPEALKPTGEVTVKFSSILIIKLHIL